MHWRSIPHRASLASLLEIGCRVDCRCIRRPSHGPHCSWFSGSHLAQPRVSALDLQPWRPQLEACPLQMTRARSRRRTAGHTRFRRMRGLCCLMTSWGASGISSSTSLENPQMPIDTKLRTRSSGTETRLPSRCTDCRPDNHSDKVARSIDPDEVLRSTSTTCYSL